MLQGVVQRSTSYLKLGILEQRYNLESVQAWNMREASTENKSDLQRRADEGIEGRGSQSPNLVSIVCNQSILALPGK